MIEKGKHLGIYVDRNLHFIAFCVCCIEI